MFSRVRCLHCGRALALAATGRPKKFCAARCRVAWHREHQRAAAYTLHGALGTERIGA